MNKKNSMKKPYVKNLLSALITTSLWLPAIFANAENHGQEHEEHYEVEHVHDHGDNPIVTKVMFDQLELRNADGANQNVIEAQAWIGKDVDKFWLKMDVEKRDSETENAEVQALYSHAIAPYWDLQMGIRQNLKPTPARTWGVLGVQGLAPYFFDVDAAVFVGEAGRSAARFSAKYDLLFTQRLILSPEVDVNIYGQNDIQTGTGSGLSDINVGLRLRYEIRRELAPYVGVNWNKKFGATADFATAKKEVVSDTEWVLGLRFWF